MVTFLFIQFSNTLLHMLYCSWLSDEVLFGYFLMVEFALQKDPPELMTSFWASAVIQSHHSTEPWVVNLQGSHLPPLQFHI